MGIGSRGNKQTSIKGQVQDLDQRLMQMEARFAELGYDMKRIVVSEHKKRWKFIPQSETYFGLYTALCVDTIDPLKQGRVRFYSPELNTTDTQIEQCEWAWPISAMGGFDDCGLVWVPPAGSLLCIIFGRGSRRYPYYIGTTWARNRGPDGEHNFGFNVQEFYDIHEGHRKGYLVGSNDGSQSLPQWNTENYNGLDVHDRVQEYDTDSIAQRKITYPNVYGFKTPQKHYYKMVDGNYKCGNKYKRIEIGSSLNNWMIFKDDFLHPAGEWAHPQCNCGGEGGDETLCNDADGNPLEKDGTCVDPKSRPKCANPYFKHQNECAPYKGPGTPQDNKAALNQSGIQLLTRGGITMIMDDSVDQPRVPSDGLAWENGMYGYDFGCTNKCMSKFKVVSLTGHRIEMSDEEDVEENRGPKNYIRLLSACGNLVELNDETKNKRLAGAKRGITLQSTSKHTIEMIDEDNEQASPIRQEIGKPDDESMADIDPTSRPISKAKKAFIRIRTGYGLEMKFQDEASQEETQQQHIQILSPQKDNKERGPHIMRFQEAPENAGYVMLRVGGNYLCSTYDNHYTIVGEEKNPSDKITIVSKNTYIQTEETYINKAKMQMFIADDAIVLDAGLDCPDETGKKSGCLSPVLVWQPGCFPNTGRIAISDRVFATASKDAPLANIFHMAPFIGEGDGGGALDPCPPPPRELEEQAEEEKPAPADLAISEGFLRNQAAEGGMIA